MRRIESIPSLVTQTAFLKNPKVRRSLGWFGGLFVVSGAIWSVLALNLLWSDISFPMLIVNMVLLTPISILTSAVSFQITAKACGQTITTRRALVIVSSANIAELLPLPGGALVRGAALVRAGAGVKDATRLVLLTAFLTLGLVFMISAVALSLLASLVWLWFLLVAIVGTIGIVGILKRRVRANIIFAMVAVRLAEQFITSLRLIVAFATFDAVLGWIEAALYTVAPTLGAAAGIVPAGIGVNEAIAAGLATLVASSSALAFLSVALNRTIGLICGALILAATGVMQRN